jgi:hypothetical protein
MGSVSFPPPPFFVDCPATDLLYEGHVLGDRIWRVLDRELDSVPCLALQAGALRACTTLSTTLFLSTAIIVLAISTPPPIYISSIGTLTPSTIRSIPLRKFRITAPPLPCLC